MFLLIVVCCALLLSVDPVRVLFTVNPDDKNGHDAGYYRSKFEAKLMRKPITVPLGLVVRVLPDAAIHYLRHRVSQVRMGEITGVQSIAPYPSLDPDKPKEYPRAEMEFRALPRAPDELLANKTKAQADVLKAIEKACLPLCGLGGFTSIVTDGGQAIQSRANTLYDCAVTTGNGLTAYDSAETLIQLAIFACVNYGDATLAITGGRGSIGLAVAKLLAPLVKHVVLIGRPHPDSDIHGAEAMKDIGTGNLEWTTDLEYGMSQADLFIGAAGGEKSLIVPSEMVKSGMIGVDVSRPRHGVPNREDVLVVAGGVKTLPGQIYQTFRFGLQDGECYACMGETMTMALSNLQRCNRSIGTLELEDIFQIGRLAKKHGIVTAHLRKVDDLPLDVQVLYDFLAHRPGILADARWRRIQRFREALKEGIDLERMYKSPMTRPTPV